MAFEEKIMTIGVDDEQVLDQLVGVMRDRLSDDEGEEYRELVHHQAITLIESGLFAAGIAKLTLMLKADPQDDQARETVIRATELLQ